MNPSLLLIPDRYKASKLYSQIPDSGAGDLAFTRANDTATRVNSEGLIEKVRTNIALYSEEFDDSYWEKEQSSISANVTIAPDGTLTADKLVEDTSNAEHIAYRIITGTGLNFSFFAKPAGRNFIAVLAQNGTFSYFNISNGTLGTISAGSLATITDAGNGWYRCSLFNTHPTAGAFISLATADGTQIYTGDGTSGAFIWGAQLETGDIATPYIPTTTAAVSVGMTANIPRIDYTGGGCGKLLLEPQRTNLALFSEQLNNSEYTTDNATFSANAGVSPDGFINAELLTENSANAGHGFSAPIAERGTTGQPLTTSIFAKVNGRRYISLIGGFDSGNSYYALFDLQDGVVAAFSNSGSTTYIGSTITNFGNGWYRCTLTGSTTLPNRILFSYLADSPTGISAFGIKTYTGNGTAGVFLYGLQAEQGSYPTSYIPTLGASVTRSADAASKTGISSLIGQTQGTIYWEGDRVNKSVDWNFLVTLQDQPTTSFIEILINTNNVLIAQVLTNGANYQSILSAPLTNGVKKVALAYNANDLVLYVNGVQIGTNNAVTIPPLNELTVGFTPRLSPTQYADGIATTALYTTRLSNSELATLTSL